MNHFQRENNMRIWYPNGLYYTLGDRVKQFSEWEAWWDQRCDEAYTNEPPRTRFEIWELRTLIATVFVSCVGIAVEYFKTGMFFEGPWWEYVAVAVIAIPVWFGWRRLTRRWRSDEARKEYWDKRQEGE
jgi:hypothetical protein